MVWKELMVVKLIGQNSNINADVKLRSKTRSKLIVSLHSSVFCQFDWQNIAKNKNAPKKTWERVDCPYNEQAIDPQA